MMVTKYLSGQIKHALHKNRCEKKEGQWQTKELNTVSRISQPILSVAAWKL